MAEKPQCVVILDFGGQYTQLIARRVRELNVYSLVLPYTATAEEVRALEPQGVIFSGGPASVLDPGAPRVDEEIFRMGVPVLGICYGMQLMAHLHGAPSWNAAAQREYGRTVVTRWTMCTIPCCNGMSDLQPLLDEPHLSGEACPPEGFRVPWLTPRPARWRPWANDQRRMYGVQFHPEVTHTDEGTPPAGKLPDGYLRLPRRLEHGSLCVDIAVRQIREQVGDGTVAAGPCPAAWTAPWRRRCSIGPSADRLTCVYVDHGFMRKGESEQVVEVFGKVFPVRADSRGRVRAISIADLKGVTDPEQKRKIIGRDFVRGLQATRPEKLGKLRLFRPGHHLSRRDRERSGHGQRRSSRATTTWAACPRSWALTEPG